MTVSKQKKQDKNQSASKRMEVDPRNISHPDEYMAAAGEIFAQGVPVRLGAKVWFSNQQVDGYVSGWTDQLCIMTDDRGYQHAERWGHVMVQAGGPPSEQAADASAPPAADPFYQLATRMDRLSKDIERAYVAWDLATTDEHTDRVYGAINTLLDDLYATSRENLDDWLDGDLPPVKFAPKPQPQQQDELPASLQKAQATIANLQRQLDKVTGGQQQ